MAHANNHGTLRKGFPWKLVPFCTYNWPHCILIPPRARTTDEETNADIFSQILGAMIAAFVVAGMYWQQISFVKEVLEANNMAVVSATGPAGIFASYPADGQHNHGYLFL